MPAGFDVIVPVPIPFLLTVTEKDGITELTALNAFRRRPVEITPFNAGTGTPVLRMAFRICATVRAGFAARTNPTTPVT